jgi:antitoxin component YwqK of YwqJK toxin-antitoxin module
MTPISTAMVSTGHQARLAIKLILFVAIIWIVASAAENPSVIHINMKLHENEFRQRDGFLFYHGKKFSGIAYSFFANGDTASVIPYANGREDGVVRKYFNKYQLSEERSYVSGEKEGIHKGWFSNGALRFLYTFDKGAYNGECIEWFEDGRIYRWFNYSAGYEKGRQQMWWPDGSVRANYVVKNGEQYGLIGRKLCINSSHEEQ